MTHQLSPTSTVQWRMLGSPAVHILIVLRRLVHGMAQQCGAVMLIG